MRAIIVLCLLLLLTTWVSIWQQNLAVGVYGSENKTSLRTCIFIDAFAGIHRKRMNKRKSYWGLHGCPIYVELK